MASFNEDMSQDEYDDLEDVSQDKEEEKVKDGFVQTDGESSDDDDFVPEKYKKSQKKKKMMEQEQED